MGSAGWQAAAMFSCPVCGAAELTVKPYEGWPVEDVETVRSPYEQVLGRPSYGVCPNCGFEFGNDDNPGTAAPSPSPTTGRPGLKWVAGDSSGSAELPDMPGSDASIAGKCMWQLQRGSADRTPWRTTPGAPPKRVQHERVHIGHD